MRYLPLFVLLFSCAALRAQNHLPVLGGLSANADWSQQSLQLQFDVADADQDPLEIAVYFSNNDGKSYEITPQATCTGDLGFPVSPGAGKVVLCNIGALAGGAVGNFTVRVVALDRKTLDIQALVNRVDSTRLRADLAFVAGIRHRTAGLAHLQAVHDTMVQRFQDYRLATEDLSWAYSGGYTARNVAASNPGLLAPDSVVIVDAHYDSVSNGPGADDNGSGTVAVWEIARVLHRIPGAKTLRWMGFDLEESGLLGSIRYVSNNIPASEHIKSVYNFEMIGYYSEKANSQTLPTGFNLLFPDAYNAVSGQQFKGNFITNVGNTASAGLSALFEKAALQYVPGLRVVTVNVPGTGTIASDLRRSDHAPFWDAGYQALMLTDGANFRNPNYHKPGDTLGVLNFTFMSNVTKATLAAIAQSAGLYSGDQAFAKFPGTVGVSAPLNDCNISVSHQNAGLLVRTEACARPQLQLELFDVGGRRVLNQTLLLSPHAQLILPLPELPAGLYVARVRDGQALQQFKLMWP